jgi:hypothetical protein
MKTVILIMLICIATLTMIGDVRAQNSSSLDNDLVAEIQKTNRAIEESGHPGMHQIDWLRELGKKFTFNQLWPIDAEVITCRDSRGKDWRMTGEGAAAWFHYGGAGGWKDYETVPMRWLLMRAYGDCHPDRPGNVLGDIVFTIKEKYGEQWSANKKVINGPTNTCRTYFVAYKPRTGSIRIEAGGGFYLTIYEVMGAKQQ